MEKKVTSPAIKGIMISLVLIVFSLIIQFMDLTQNKAVSSIGIIVFACGIIWSCIYYAQQMDANVTFGNVFSDGFKTSAAVTAIMIVFMIISLKFLFPESVDKMLEQARTNMAGQNMSDENMEKALSMTKKFLVPFAIGGVLVMYLFIGVIASLIGGAAAKKNPADPFAQQVQ